MPGSQILAALLILSAAALGQTGDPRSVEIAQTMMQAMGGQGNWTKARFLRWDFKVTIGGQQRASRSHLWDRHTGRYRLEDKTKDGATRVILMNLANKQGSVYLDGKKQEAPASAKALEDAYGAYINDFYWLAMPWKWLDPGVNLKSLGSKTKDGETFDVVQLSFDKVGLTPGDRYNGWVSSKSHLMTYWEFTLQSGNKGAWSWEYGDYGGIKLASNHTSPPNNSIHMGDVAVLSTVDDAYFADPARNLSSLK